MNRRSRVGPIYDRGRQQWRNETATRRVACEPDTTKTDRDTRGTVMAQEVNTTGDGFLSMFARARAALDCAASIRDATDEVGLPVRTGVHTGEVELLPGDIGGVAVHAAARVMALGGASGIMVSSNSQVLIEDGGLRFESKGFHRFKGLPSPIEVFALVD
jgi:class 3 adenylate cyclase